MPTLRRDASFIVRIWWERCLEEGVRWRGQAVDAQTRQSAYFESIPALVAFIEKWVGDSGMERQHNDSTEMHGLTDDKDAQIEE